MHLEAVNKNGQTLANVNDLDDLLGLAMQRNGNLALGAGAAVVLQRSKDESGKWGPDASLPPRVRISGRAWVEGRPVETEVEVDLADLNVAMEKGVHLYGDAFAALVARARELRRAQILAQAKEY
ncbi:MAG TPA: hypothetical protein VNZ52_16930 [Candidatus Thermoplasmatota archaeon]|nr:hypothetical protein [Candidatus Thermoplasmatota archaeon]